LDFLKGYDAKMQQNIMDKVVGHKLLVNVLPPYLQDAKKLKQTQQLFNKFQVWVNKPWDKSTIF
jgi:hypothetical protein